MFPKGFTQGAGGANCGGRNRVHDITRMERRALHFGISSRDQLFDSSSITLLNVSHIIYIYKLHVASNGKYQKLSSASITLNHLVDEREILGILSINLQLCISFLLSEVPPNFATTIAIIQRDLLVDGMACPKETIFPASSSANFHAFIKPTSDTCPINFGMWR